MSFLQDIRELKQGLRLPMHMNERPLTQIISVSAVIQFLRYTLVVYSRLPYFFETCLNLFTQGLIKALQVVYLLR